MVEQLLGRDAQDYIKFTSLADTIMGKKPLNEYAFVKRRGLGGDVAPFNKELTSDLENIAQDPSYQNPVNKVTKAGVFLTIATAVGLGVSYLLGAFGGGGPDESKPVLSEVVYHAPVGVTAITSDDVDQYWSNIDGPNVLYGGSIQRILYNSSSQTSQNVDNLYLTQISNNEVVIINSQGDQGIRNIVTGQEKPLTQMEIWASNFEDGKIVFIENGQGYKQLGLQDVDSAQVIRLSDQISEDNLTYTDPEIDSEAKLVAWINNENWTYEVFNFDGSKVGEFPVDDEVKTHGSSQFDIAKGKIFGMGPTYIHEIDIATGDSQHHEVGVLVHKLQSDGDTVMFGGYSAPGVYSYNLASSELTKVQSTSSDVRFDNDENKFTWTVQTVGRSSRDVYMLDLTPVPPTSAPTPSSNSSNPYIIPSVLAALGAVGAAGYGLYKKRDTSSTDLQASSDTKEELEEE